MTGQDAQIRLARRIDPADAAADESGKNSSGSASRQAAARHQSSMRMTVTLNPRYLP